MALSDLQQIKKLLVDSRHVLIAFAPTDNGDSAAGALALKTFLEKERRQVDIASDNFKVPKKLEFLSGIAEIKSSLNRLQKFIIKVDVSKAPIETLSYDVKDGWLSIYLTPKQGSISKQELRTAQSTFKYDLIIAVNTPDLESLGSIFANNTDLFYRTPIINIDHQTANERFGQVNLVDLTAVSAAEIIYQLIKEADEKYLDAALATTLLAGMILATKSFTIPHLAPRALRLASELVERGAEREKIVHQLYRTHSIAALKLWGQALTHLQNDSRLGLVWTTLTRDDFIRNGAATEELKGVVDELISNSPEAKVSFLLYEITAADKTQINGIVTADKNHDALALARSFHPEGNKTQAKFIILNKTLSESEELVLKTIRDGLK